MKQIISHPVWWIVLVSALVLQALHFLQLLYLLLALQLWAGYMMDALLRGAVYAAFGFALRRNRSIQWYVAGFFGVVMLFLDEIVFRIIYRTYLYYDQILTPDFFSTIIAVSIGSFLVTSPFVFAISGGAAALCQRWGKVSDH